MAPSEEADSDKVTMSAPAPLKLNILYVVVTVKL